MGADSEVEYEVRSQAGRSQHRVSQRRDVRICNDYDHVDRDRREGDRCVHDWQMWPLQREHEHRRRRIGPAME